MVWWWLLFLSSTTTSWDVSLPIPAMGTVGERSKFFHENALKLMPKLDMNSSIIEWMEMQAPLTFDLAAGTYLKWSRYQEAILRSCDELWSLVPEDRLDFLWDFRVSWTRSMPRYGKFVYVPLPWHQLVEQAVLYENYEPLKRAANIFKRLNFEKFSHFLTTGQCSLLQIKRHARRGGFRFPYLDRIELVFNGRLENIDRFSSQLDLDFREIPTVLLYRREIKVKQQKTQSVFFSGACTSPLRERLHLYLSVRPCGNKQRAYVNELAQSTWALAPRSTFPNTHLLAEAIQAETLPIYIFDWKVNTSKPLPPSRKIIPLLPYSDIGLRWRDLGIVTTADKLTRLTEMIHQTPTELRENYLRWARHLFTLKGSFHYMLIVLKVYSDALLPGT